MTVELPTEWQLPTAAAAVENFPGAIGLIGCGEISTEHLSAYHKLGFPVRTLCDKTQAKADSRASEFFPDARRVTDYRTLLADPDITIVDIATHTDVRGELIREALLAGKHVLSQKPFVEDLAMGQELVDLAEQNGLLLAVNQNARWAPHFCYMRNAIAAGRLGELAAVRFSIQWDHTWTRDTRFAEIRHLLLYDFAVHWFDLMQAFFPTQPWQSVYATLRSTVTQNMMPPLIGQVVVNYPNAQASLILDADTPHLPINQTYLAGSQASLHSTGPDYSQQTISVADSNGSWTVPYSGGWFPDGFGGAMAELANSLKAGRIPENNARDNLKSLELCYAAIASAESGSPVFPGSVHGLPPGGMVGKGVR